MYLEDYSVNARVEQHFSCLCKQKYGDGKSLCFYQDGSDWTDLSLAVQTRILNGEPIWPNVPSHTSQAIFPTGTFFRLSRILAAKLI